jgi:hypothetical protein
MSFNSFLICPGPPVDAPININFCATNYLLFYFVLTISSILYKFLLPNIDNN